FLRLSSPGDVLPRNPKLSHCDERRQCLWPLDGDVLDRGPPRRRASPNNIEVRGTSGGSMASLASRSAIANRAVESALSIARPPRFSVADSARIRLTSPTTCAPVPGPAAAALFPAP